MIRLFRRRRRPARLDVTGPATRYAGRAGAYARPRSGSLSTVQLRNRMILSARRIIAEHWPRVDRCPICGSGWPCPPTDTAYGYLATVGQDNWAPPQHARSRR